MREYLNLDERNTLLLIMNSATHAQDSLTTFNNLTVDERKWLKTSTSFAKKAMKSIAERLPSKERLRIAKSTKDFEVRILTKSGAIALEKRLLSEYETINIKRIELEKMASEVIHSKCENCTISCNSCDTFDILDKFKISRYELMSNCPYAYKTVKNKLRKSKKTKNRFDDDIDEYEYNFKTKEI